MLREIAKIASKLDSLGMTKEADVLDKFLVKAAQDYSGLSDKPAQPGYATHGYPGGDKDKAYQGFLYASPRTLAEFNDQLAELFEFVPETSQVVSTAVLRSLPYGETQWTQKTANAFSAFCSLVGAIEAGAGEAGRNWESYANAHGYEPTLAGVIKFWDKYKQAAYAFIASDLKSRQKAPSAQPSVSQNPSPQSTSALPPVNPDLKKALYFRVSGGSGVSKEKGGKLMSETARIITAIEASTDPKTREWFSREPNLTIPTGLTRNLNQATVDDFLKENELYYNKDIKKIYGMMIAAAEKSKSSRDISDRMQNNFIINHP